MANYYAERKKAFIDLNKVIETAKSKNQTELDILRIVFWLTERYEIGENTILKRLKLLAKVRGDFKIKGDKIEFKQENNSKDK